MPAGMVNNIGCTLSLRYDTQTWRVVTMKKTLWGHRKGSDLGWVRMGDREPLPVCLLSDRWRNGMSQKHRGAADRKGT